MAVILRAIGLDGGKAVAVAHTPDEAWEAIESMLRMGASHVAVEKFVRHKPKE